MLYDTLKNEKDFKFTLKLHIFDFTVELGFSYQISKQAEGPLNG